MYANKREKNHLNLPGIVEQQKEASGQTESHCTESEYLNLSQERNNDIIKLK